MALVLLPVLLAGLVVGFIAGLWSARRGANAVVALGWAAGVLLLAVVAYTMKFENPQAESFMTYLLVVPFAAALPLGVGFHLGSGAGRWIRR